jgi:hypothetical protein
MSDKDMRLFTARCANEFLKFADSHNPWSVKAHNAIKKYANGEITKLELRQVMYAFWITSEYDDWYAPRSIGKSSVKDVQIDKLLTYFK